MSLMSTERNYFRFWNKVTKLSHSNKSNTPHEGAFWLSHSNQPNICGVYFDHAYSPVVYTSLSELANSDSWIWVRASATSLHVGLMWLRSHWSNISTLHWSGSAAWWEAMSLSCLFGTPSTSPSWYHLVMSTCFNWISRLSRFRLLSVREYRSVFEV